MVNRLWFILVACFLLPQFSSAREIPKYVNYVSDFADALSSNDQQKLNKRIKEISESTATEIAIVIESSLEGDNEFDRSLAFARTYKVGAEGMNTGVLIYVAMQEHKIFIQTADKTQGALTDYVVGLIIENSMKPEFREGNYYQGLRNAVESINEVLKGEFDPDKVVKKKKRKGISAFTIFIIILIVFFVLSRFGGGKGNGGFGRGGGYFLPGMLLGGGGGGWGGGRSGGGFGGFGGGGGFNGGGAGGSW